MAKAFSIPQRQSLVGILLIFTSTLYKLVRGFWAALAYFVFKRPDGDFLLYIGLGLAVLLVLIAIYSYFDYRKFLFHIDYEAEEFILKKGVFNSDFVSIPFDKIQQVNFKRGILQRIAGVYSLVIDTAGSNEKEVEIKAVNTEDANQLADILNSLKESKNTDTEVLEANQINAEVKTEEIQKEKWTYRLSLSTLIKTGLSSNFFRGFGLIFVFISTIFNELNQFFREETSQWESQFTEDIGGVATESILFISALIFLLLALSIFITTAEVFIKYFNLNLTQTKSSLDLQMGLRTNTRVSLKPIRVQILKIVTNPIQKRLNLYKASLWVASSEDNDKKSVIQIPGLEKATIQKIKSFLYQSSKDESGITFRPHWVELSRRLLVGVIPVVAIGILQCFTNFIEFRWWILVASVFVLLYAILQFRIYNSLCLKIGEEFITKSYSAWDESTEIVEIYKLQGITVKQPLWYKGRNLVHVIFHNAAGDITFRAVDKAILHKMNFCLYAIERTNKAWM
ncbi:PH domain-containing protein [Zunongwangia sp. HGR-M22]|uniref:PH domain-containing protein n=1 Tax=Zunongwangia sp. HGR-M22 TaxID=3015168 RepID=UPI0022DD72C0|nr:PH domain-containing protein [Zunongwangia sp. HGR-M22]WBL26917.1 PH domain-containing protein [Zunongwangia sp. HGR-M22]